MSDFYVVRPEELAALNFLPPGHPRPVRVEWINRGTDRPLNRQSIELLLRTMFADMLSPSVVKLHRSAGLRIQLRSEAERLRFATDFASAKSQENAVRANHLTMMFVERSGAAIAAEQLIEIGVPKSAVSVLWRAGQFMDADHRWVEGHSLLSVAGATAGGSIAGLIAGIAVLAIPGIGSIAAIGGLAASSVTTSSLMAGLFGATTAAISRMMSDPDVDDVSMQQYADSPDARRAFVSVDLEQAPGTFERVRTIMKQNGGRMP